MISKMPIGRINMCNPSVLIAVRLAHCMCIIIGDHQQKVVMLLGAGSARNAWERWEQMSRSGVGLIFQEQSEAGGSRLEHAESTTQ
jgi:hypothetical protein